MTMAGQGVQDLIANQQLGNRHISDTDPLSVIVLAPRINL